ncbi:MAG: serine hydrolase domain-containing protein [Pseudomonadota bacterium]
MRVIGILSSALVCLTVGCASPPAAAEKEPDLSAMIDSLFVAYDVGKRPGYAIGVMHQGELAFAKGYGLADIESETPINPETAFNIASLSKQFTAAAIAKEIVETDLALSDKLSEHWPDLPQEYGQIEIGHLVYMTSGLPEYYSLPSPKGGWASEDQFTVDDAIAAVWKARALEYAPGTRWSYSNINYQLMAEIAARRHSTSFAERMQTAFFEPLGMTHTWVDAPIQVDRPERAASYQWRIEAMGWVEAPRLSPHYGGSGMFSSLRDLAKWDAALYRDKAFGEAFSAQMLATKEYGHDKTNDAFGLVYGSYRGLETIWYEGGDYGVSAYMARMPERDQTVICLSNIGNGGCLSKAQAVMDVLIAFDEDADFVRDGN